MVENDFPTPGHPFPIQGPSLKRRLDDIVSPRLAEFGVEWLGDYRWAEPGDIPIRRIVGLVLMKGAGAIMSWGYSLRFVPAICGRRLAYHRTQRSAKADVFEFESSYEANLKGGPRFREIVRDVGYFDATLDAYLHEVLPQIGEWWARVGSIDEIEAELELQCRSAAFHHPNPMYVLSFIKAVKGDHAAAQTVLDDWLSAQEESVGPVHPKLRGSLKAALDEVRCKAR